MLSIPRTRGFCQSGEQRERYWRQRSGSLRGRQPLVFLWRVQPCTRPRRLTCLHEQRRTLCVLTKLRALSEEGLALSPSPCLAVHAGAATALQRQPGEAGSLSSRAGGEVEAQRPAASAVGSRWFIELYLNVQH